MSMALSNEFHRRQMHGHYAGVALTLFPASLHLLSPLHVVPLDPFCVLATVQTNVNAPFTIDGRFCAPDAEDGIDPFPIPSH